jgi:hypothetical protein
MLGLYSGNLRMKTQIGKHTISYSLTHAGVHILHDASLHALFLESPISGIKKLSTALLASFHEVQGRPLSIVHSSLVLEIWGHYYFEKYYRYFRWMIPFSSLRSRLDLATQEFDCGEAKIDSNRWIWDLLTPTLSLAQVFLSDKIKII